MLTAFIQNIESKKLFSKTNKLLVGVSGGKDSMVLSHLLTDAGYNYSVAHCNFCLRSEEADREEEFVKTFFQKKKIEVFTIRFNTTEYAEINKCSIQMAARNLRYNWFLDLKEKHHFDYVLTAHHLNDSIETFFINLMRGSGINGLKGIPEKTEDIVRPLLFAGSEQLKKYQIENNIPFKEDSSNQEANYLRNKLRHQLIPLLKEINPSFEDVFRKELIYIKQANDLVESLISQELQAICEIKNGLTKISILKIKKSNYPELLIHQVLKPFSFDSSTEQQLLASMKTKHSGKQFTSTTHICLIDRDFLIVQPIQKNHIEKEYYIIENTDTIRDPISLSFETYSEQKIITEKNYACFDADKINFPLTLRKWNKGDAFHPLGMKGTKKLSDYFINQKYSIFQKQEQWLLTSNNEIIWIVGKQMDERFKVSEKTKKTLVVKLIHD